MARKLRVEYEGAIYHVTCRLVGSWREGDRELFRDDSDRQRFLDSLSERVDLFGIRLYQYVLMANHFHLVVETPQANCSVFMQSLLTSYTVYFNLRHRRHGHLFDGRYKAKLVQGDEYLLELSRYVHLNPVRVSELTSIKVRRKILRTYMWSSYLQYIGRRKQLDFVTYGPTLALISGGNASKHYREFVDCGLDPDMEEWGLGEDSPLSIGDSGFRDWVKVKYAELVKATRHPEDVSFRRAAGVLDPEWVLDCLAGLMDCDKACFKSRNHGQPHRTFAAYFLSRYAGLSRRDCAGYLGVTSGPAVSQLITRYHRLLDADRKLRKLASVCDEALKGETKVE